MKKILLLPTILSLFCSLAHTETVVEAPPALAFSATVWAPKESVVLMCPEKYSATMAISHNCHPVPGLGELQPAPGGAPAWKYSVPYAQWIYVLNAPMNLAVWSNGPLAQHQVFDATTGLVPVFLKGSPNREMELSIYKKADPQSLLTHYRANRILNQRNAYWISSLEDLHLYFQMHPEFKNILLEASQYGEPSGQFIYKGDQIFYIGNSLEFPIAPLGKLLKVKTEAEFQAILCGTEDPCQTFFSLTFHEVSEFYERNLKGDKVFVQHLEPGPKYSEILRDGILLKSMDLQQGSSARIWLPRGTYKLKYVDQSVGGRTEYQELTVK